MTTCCFVGISKNGFAVKGRKNMVYWCMSFLPCSLSSLLLRSFFFSLLLLLQFSLFLALVAILLPFMVTVTIYVGLIWWDFSILPLLLINHFCLLWAPFQSCSLAHWPLGLHNTWACPVLSLFSTIYFMTNSYPFGSAVSLSLLFQRAKFWVSLYLSL